MVLKGLMYTGLYSSSVCSSRLHYLPSRLLWSNWLYYKAGDFYTLPLRVGVHVHLWWWSFHNHSWHNICNFNLHYRLVAFDSLLLLAATSTPCDTHTHTLCKVVYPRKEGERGNWKYNKFGLFVKIPNIPSHKQSALTEAYLHNLIVTLFLCSVTCLVCGFMHSFSSGFIYVMWISCYF